MAPKSLDPYAVLELERGCTESDIQKAYKKQCLKWHPDKNRENQEEASKKFILAKEAFDLLFDKSARAEYDNKKEMRRRADEKTRERMDKADGERRRRMEDLFKREKEFADRSKPHDREARPKTEAEKKREENRVRQSIEEMRRRLEKEVNEEIRNQQELCRRVYDERMAAAAAAAKKRPQLKVEWKRGDYNDMRIRSIFAQYGKIAAVTGIIVKKSGKGRMCVVEFEAGEVAWGAEKETGNEGEKLKAEWMTEPEKVEIMKKDEEAAQAEEHQSEAKEDNGCEGKDLSGMSFEELEAMLLGDVQPPAKKLKDGPSWKEDV